MFLSTLSFAVANILVKQVSHIPAMEVVFFRCSLATMLCFAGIRRAGADWRGSNRKMLFAPRFVRHDGTLFFLYDGAKHSACVGDDDTVSLADLHEHHRDLFVERKRVGRFSGCFMRRHFGACC